MKVYIKDLRERAAFIERMLREQNETVKISSNFAYGMYSYFIDCEIDGKHRQYWTGYGTKKECYEYLNRVYYEALYEIERSSKAS